MHDPAVAIRAPLRPTQAAGLGDGFGALSAESDCDLGSQRQVHNVATVAHELRAPLTVISGWVELLLHADVPPASPLAEGLAAIRRAVARQQRLLADLLDGARLDAGKVRLVLEPVDLRPLCRQAVDDVRSSAAAKRLKLAFVDGGALASHTVRGDADRLQQVVWNLLFNAIKFTAPGGWVRLALSRIDAEVRVVVSDNGRGIEPRDLPHVFDRFRQADISEPGLGLGLTLARDLAELHGGSVLAHSDGAGRGAAFTVTLPAERPSRRGRSRR